MQPFWATQPGAAYGVSGQIMSSGTSYAGVYGNNLRVGAGVGVGGMGSIGVGGESSNANGFGVFGIGNQLPYNNNSVNTAGAGGAFNGWNLGLIC